MIRNKISIDDVECNWQEDGLKVITAKKLIDISE